VAGSRIFGNITTELLKDWRLLHDDKAFPNGFALHPRRALNDQKRLAVLQIFLILIISNPNNGQSPVRPF
jgi:hypothetical protein